MTIQETNAPGKTSVPQVSANPAKGFSLGKYMSGHNIFMMACCVAMVAGTGILIASAPAGQSLGQTLLLAAPMAGCIGMHLVMHRFMGKSCHSSSKQEAKDE